jgi:hypothetical protein
MELDIFRHRNRLDRAWAKLKGGELTIGFLGGSITDARAHHNWPEPVIAWFAGRFPNALIRVENAAIGATGSELAVFRAERDIIARGCDLVFVEYAVNDYHADPVRRGNTREGLLRKLLKGNAGDTDTVLTYTYNQDMYDDMMTDRVPSSIADFELLADHYGIGSVWMGLHALREVQLGRMDWEEWLPDGLHPTHRGSYSYAQSVIAYLEKELALTEEQSRSDTELAEKAGTGLANGTAKGTGGGSAEELPPAFHPGHWENSDSLDLATFERTGPWVIRRWPHLEWIDTCLTTSAVGARLAFTFQGRCLTLGMDFGTLCADFRYRLDEGEWITVQLQRPDWCPREGWFLVHTIAEVLAEGEHRCELQVIHGNRPRCEGSHFRLAFVGVIR